METVLFIVLILMALDLSALHWIAKNKLNKRTRFRARRFC